MPGDRRADGAAQPPAKKAALLVATIIPATKVPLRHIPKELRGGLRWRRNFVPLAGANGMTLFSDRRGNMVVSTDHHGDKHKRVVEEVQFDAWDNQLQYAKRYWLAPEIVVHCRLGDQQQMLDVMPELDHQRHRPPLAPGARKPFAQN